MNIVESMSLALDAVRAQKLRSSLTLLSVGLGVFALISSSSITSTLDQAVKTQLADLGEHSFLIQRTPTFSFGGNWRKYMRRKPLTYPLSQEFKRRLTTTNLVSVSNTSPGMIIKSGLQSTDPDVSLIGIDDLYTAVNAVTLAEGRSVAEQDVALGKNVAIVGLDVVAKLFPRGDAIGKTITIKNQSFLIVGILQKRGGVLGQSQDNRVLIPITTFVKYYTWEWDTSVDISVKAYSGDALPATVDEAIGILRGLRGVRPGDENDFELDTNDALSSQFGGLSMMILIVAWGSGLGALIAAGIGIMNIMLVSVKERTREIGVRKALGARRSWILRQFLIEAVTLCQLGALAGVISGVSLGLVTTLMLSTSNGASMTFSMPWTSIIFSVIACTVIGLVSGLYPAYRAASLDPIEALRYE